MGTLLIRGGRVVDPSQDIDRLDDVIARALEEPREGAHAGAGDADEMDGFHCATSWPVYR